MEYLCSYYYFVKDEFGNILKIKNTSHNLVAEYEYDAWGNCTILTNVNGIAEINPFQYRGYYRDSESGFYYLQMRYYDPAVRRFISPDNYGLLPDLAQLSELNLYTYCNNNPVILINSTAGKSDK